MLRQQPIRSSDACRKSRAHARLASQSERRWVLGKSRVLATLYRPSAKLSRCSFPPRRRAATVARGNSRHFGAVTLFAEFSKMLWYTKYPTTRPFWQKGRFSRIPSSYTNCSNALEVCFIIFTSSINYLIMGQFYSTKSFFHFMCAATSSHLNYAAAHGFSAQTSSTSPISSAYALGRHQSLPKSIQNVR